MRPCSEVNAFFSHSSKFIQDKYSGYSQKEASYIAGAVYDCSLVLSAIVGILIVRFSCCFSQLRWINYNLVLNEISF